MNFNVSFVVPALNEEIMLPRLLNSIRGLSQTADVRVQETIIVDAGSSDGTAEIAYKMGCVVINAKSGRIALSRNLGAARATGNILAFIDADCELPTDWLTAVASELRFKSVVAVGSSMAANPADTTWVERAWFELAHRSDTSEQSVDVDWLATFNLVIRKSAFSSVGGFDEALTTCEDVEFGYRLSSLGILRRLNFCGVIHHGESKTLKDFRRREAWRARGAIRNFFRHWRRPREFISFFMPIIVVGCLFVSTIFAITSVILLYVGSPGVQLTVILAVLTGPVLIILLMLRRGVRWQKFGPCGILMCVYFIARFTGMFRPVERLRRTNS